MANNYTPNYNQYLTQTAGYALPSSVRTYSVFDPASNTWRRMTNDGMSPMPQGNQADIQAALAQARQTQGTVYPVQGMGQGQSVEMHPGYTNPPVQAAGGQNQRTPTNPAGTLRDLGYGVTAQTVGNYDYSKAHGNENPVAPLTQPGVVYPPARNLAGYDPSNPGIAPTQNVPLAVNHAQTPTAVVSDPDGAVAAEIGQSVPIREATPNFNFRPEDRYTPERAGELLNKSVGKAIAVPGEIALTLLAPWTRAASAARLGLGVTPRLALSTPRAEAAVNIGSRLNNMGEAIGRYGKNFYNRVGGFLRREHTPTANFTVDAAGNVQATSPYTTNVISDALRNGYQNVRGWFTR